MNRKKKTSSIFEISDIVNDYGNFWNRRETDQRFLRNFIKRTLFLKKYYDSFRLNEKVFLGTYIRFVTLIYSNFYFYSEHFNNPDKAIYLYSLPKVFYPEYLMVIIFLNRFNLFFNNKLERKPDYSFKNIFFRIGDKNVISSNNIRFFCLDLYTENRTNIIRPVRHKKKRNEPVFRFGSLCFLPFNYCFLVLCKIPRIYLDQEIKLEAYMNYTPYYHIPPKLFTSNTLIVKVCKPAKVVQLKKDKSIHFDLSTNISITNFRNLENKGVVLE